MIFQRWGSEEGTKNVADWSVVWLGQLNAKIVPVLTFNEETRARGGLSQNLFADTHETMFQLSMDQLVGNVRGFVEYRKNNELLARPGGIVTKAVRLPFIREEHLAKYIGCFTEYLWNTFQKLHNYYMSVD